MFRRILGALTFQKGIYAEVEKDKTFTQSAWFLVAIVAFLNKLGSTANVASSQGFGSWAIAAIVSALFALLGFAVSTFIISWVGKAVFSAKIDFNEAVRVLGLAYIWNIVGFLGILAIISSALTCVLSPVTFIAAILFLIAWLLAAKEALDLDWFQTIITIVLGWGAGQIIVIFSSVILDIMGIPAAGFGSLFSN